MQHVLSAHYYTPSIYHRLRYNSVLLVAGGPLLAGFLSGVEAARGRSLCVCLCVGGSGVRVCRELPGPSSLMVLRRTLSEKHRSRTGVLVTSYKLQFTYTHKMEGLVSKQHKYTICNTCIKHTCTGQVTTPSDHAHLVWKEGCCSPLLE